MNLRFGLNITAQTASDGDLHRFVEEEISLVHQVRDAGWDSVWVSHHYMPHGMQMPQPGPWLGRLIREIGEMTVGTGILILSLLNPLEVAEVYGTVDVFTQGRLILGVGLGYRDDEFRAFGIDPSERVRRFEANIAAVRSLWADGAASGIDLPWCHLDAPELGARPCQPGGPPLWIGANREPAIRRAARLGDAWLISPFTPVPKVIRQLGLYGEELRKASRDWPADVPIGREIYCAPSHDEAMAVAHQYLGTKYGAYASWRGSASTAHLGDSFAEFARDRFVIGSPDECTEQLMKLVDAGTNYLKFRTRWVGMPVEPAAASVDLLCREVVPALQAYAASKPASEMPRPLGSAGTAGGG